MAFSPEVVVGSLLGVVAGSLVTENQKLPIPGGSYGGAAVGGVLGGIAAKMLFGEEEEKKVEEKPAATPPQPQQVVVVQQQAAPARREPEPEPEYEEERSYGVQQFGRPVIIGRASARPTWGGAPAPTRRTRVVSGVERAHEVPPPPRRRMSLAEVERVARTGQRLLSQVERLADDWLEDEIPESELIEARQGRIGLGRF